MKIAAVRIHGSQLFLGFRMVLFDTECYPSCSFIVYGKTTAVAFQQNLYEQLLG